MLHRSRNLANKMSSEERFDSLRFRQRQLTVKLVPFINIASLEDQPFQANIGEYYL